MTTPFIGEIQIFGFNYAPMDWTQCNGAMLPLRQYTTLFALIGTTYGGDGQTNFQLPNLSGRAACSQGQGAGLTQHIIGDNFGAEQVSLSSNEIPSHSHIVNVYHQSNASLQSNVPAAGYGLCTPALTAAFVQNATPNTTFAPTVIGAAGGGLPHENRQPLLALNFCIALQGEFPNFN